MGRDSMMSGELVWGEFFIASACHIPLVSGLLSYFGAGASGPE